MKSATALRLFTSEPQHPIETAARDANRVPQSAAIAPPAPRWSGLGSPAADDPPRSAPPVECMKTALSNRALSPACQITPFISHNRESRRKPAVERLFQQPVRPSGSNHEKFDLCSSFGRILSGDDQARYRPGVPQPVPGHRGAGPGGARLGSLRATIGKLGVPGRLTRLLEPLGRPSAVQRAAMDPQLSCRGRPARWSDRGRPGWHRGSE